MPLPVRFRPFITSSPLFNPHQSAYCQGYSTETALLFTRNNIRHSADRGKFTILVSLDLSSAFDTIDHHLLLERLKIMFGVTGPALNWLRSYLTDRTQLVKQGDDLSIPMLLQTGVPQGSVLGPILFTSFISPVHCIATQFGVHQQQYADDIQLYMEILSDPGLANLESALLSLSSWFLHNGLALNPENSEAILLGTHAQNCTISKSQVNVAGASIPFSTSLKLLGVQLDNNLNFSKHVNSVSKSCHYHLPALHHIRSTLDLDAAKLIGHALVSSRLDYCNSILYGAPELSISKLQRVQNALARVVLQKNSATPAAPLLNSLHWLPVHSRINFKIATITYKSLHSQSPVTLLPCSTIICQPEISVHPTHCFFLPTQQKQILACLPFNLPHQTFGTNYQLTWNLHLPYHLSKPTLKLIIFSTHLDWSRDRAPQIRFATLRLVRAL